MKVSERVLNENGTFSSFPEQLREYQIRKGWTEPLPNDKVEDPNIEHGKKGKKIQPPKKKEVELD